MTEHLLEGRTFRTSILLFRMFTALVLWSSAPLTAVPAVALVWLFVPVPLLVRSRWWLDPRWRWPVLLLDAVVIVIVLTQVPEPAHGLFRVGAAAGYVGLVHFAFSASRLLERAQIDQRNGEILAELTRTMGRSLRREEVFHTLVSELRSMMQADECAIVRQTPEGGLAVLAAVPASRFREVAPRPEDFPGVGEASTLRTVTPAGGRADHVAVPMVWQESVVAVIAFRWIGVRVELTPPRIRLLEQVAMTAAASVRNAELYAEVEHRSRTDFMTGLPNQRWFQANLAAELGRAQRHHRTMSLLIIDLDHLKEINDRFGHPRGDAVICRVADRIRSTCRQFDFAARYGGEEFTVILPETSLASALHVAERFRETIAAERFEGIGSVTASIGVANYPENARTKEDLVRAADQALYDAKRSGRNRVSCLWS